MSAEFEDHEPRPSEIGDYLQRLCGILAPLSSPPVRLPEARATRRRSNGPGGMKQGPAALTTRASGFTGKNNASCRNGITEPKNLRSPSIPPALAGWLHGLPASASRDGSSHLDPHFGWESLFWEAWMTFKYRIYKTNRTWAFWGPLCLLRWLPAHAPSSSSKQGGEGALWQAGGLSPLPSSC